MVINKQKPIETKSFKLKSLSFNDEEGTFEGYASVFGIRDAQGDVVEKGAFKKTLTENGKFPILWQHEVEKPIGTFTAVEDEKGLLVKGKLVLGCQQGKEAYALLKEEAIDAMSVGITTIQGRANAQTKSRHIIEAKLWEASLVTFPANDAARIESVKSREDIASSGGNEMIDKYLKKMLHSSDAIEQKSVATVAQEIIFQKRESELCQRRWNLEYAFGDVIRGIRNDEEMTVDDKKSASAQAFDEYKALYLAWLNDMLQLEADKDAAEGETTDSTSMPSGDTSALETKKEPVIPTPETPTEPQDTKAADIAEIVAALRQNNQILKGEN
jgi:hypothetical protein